MPVKQVPLPFVQMHTMEKRLWITMEVIPSTIRSQELAIFGLYSGCLPKIPLQIIDFY